MTSHGFVLYMILSAKLKVVVGVEEILYIEKIHGQVQEVMEISDQLKVYDGDFRLV